jgi:hypothetical protein
VLLRKDGAPAGSRAIAFALGGVLALAAFALLGWDLWHHQTPQSPHRPTSLLVRYLGFYWLFDGAMRIWQWKRGRKSKTYQGYWPKRHSVPGAPESDNAGAIQAHRSESANGNSG